MHPLHSYKCVKEQRITIYYHTSPINVITTVIVCGYVPQAPIHRSIFATHSQINVTRVIEISQKKKVPSGNCDQIIIRVYCVNNVISMLSCSIVTVERIYNKHSSRSTLIIDHSDWKDDKTSASFASQPIVPHRIMHPYPKFDIYWRCRYRTSVSLMQIQYQDVSIYSLVYAGAVVQEI